LFSPALLVVLLSSLILASCIFFVFIPLPPISTLFPYTTLFRSDYGALLSSLSDEEIARARFYVVNTLERGDFLDMARARVPDARSEEHTSELQSRENLVCRLLLEKKKNQVALAEGQKDRQSDTT